MGEEKGGRRRRMGETTDVKEGVEADFGVLNGVEDVVEARRGGGEGKGGDG